MSRRSSTTATFSLKLRIPPGSNANAVREHIVRLFQDRKVRTIEHTGNSGEIYSTVDPLVLDTDSMIIKLEKKETVYL